MRLTRRNAITGSAAILATATFGDAAQSKTRRGGQPLVFAHRGASALLPEHTLEAYSRAIDDGADFIEPDLVMTRDDVLVARHENEISQTTNVATLPEFADRKATKLIDGKSVTGWFTEDFTLAELKSLRAIERLGSIRPESQRHDGRYQVPSFREIIALAARRSHALGKMIGIIPELKHSSYFAGLGLPLEETFLSEIAATDYGRRCPLVIQSFEVANLRAIHEKIGRRDNVNLLQLLGSFEASPADDVGVTYGEMASAEGLARIATYADAIGPSYRSAIPLDENGRLGAPTDLVIRGHRAGLEVYLYTFRPENRFLPADLRGPGGDNGRYEAGSIAEIRRYLDLGIDGFFTDDPALGRIAVDGRSVA